jgi:hypothetical protein
MTAAVHRVTAREPLTLLRDAMLASAILAGALVVARIAAADRPRVALALAIGLAVLIAALAAPRRALLLLVLWLVVLGFVRRVVSVAVPIDDHDPLLLAGAFGIAVVCVPALRGNALVPRSALATTVFVLQGLILASAFNPLQGGLSVGLMGLLFLLVPTIGFWIGRGLGDDAMFERLFRLVAAVGVLVAVYGLVQVLHDFPSWDAIWIRDRGYLALNVGEAMRPFGPFASSAEYVLFLGVALVACFAFGFRGPASIASLVAVPVLTVAVFLASTRGVVFTLAGALTLMAVARRRAPLLLAPAAAVAAVLIVPPLTERIAPAVVEGGRTNDLITHQVEGLSNPLSSESSTLLVHLAMIGDGLQSVVDNPLGIGGATVTVAPTTLGGETASTEADPSNLAVALGLPGFLAYVALATIALRRAYHLATERRDALPLAALGVLVVTFFQWFTGGHYAVTFIVWLALGWLDRASLEARPRPRLGAYPSLSPAYAPAAEGDSRSSLRRDAP